MNDNGTPANDPKKSNNLPINEGIRAAFLLLKRAFDCANDANAPPWDFAVEIAQLYAAGLTIIDLRWMVVKKLVQHADETTEHGDEHRSFTPGRGLNFLPTTCVLLTMEGARLAEGEKTTPADDILRDSGKSHFRTSVKPHWDAARSELSLGDRLVKRFNAPARNQELILSAFPRADWPTFIHSPLADEYDVDPKIRLNDAVYRLNRRQLANLLRFHVNGHGHSVHWSLCAAVPYDRHPRTAMEPLAAI